MVIRLKNSCRQGSRSIIPPSKQGLNINVKREEVGRLAIVCDIVACAISTLVDII